MRICERLLFLRPLQGRVACEITAGDELLLTELLFAGAFNDLPPEDCAALLSCTVAEEKGECPKMSDVLQECLKQLQVCSVEQSDEKQPERAQEHARRIARVSVECKMEDMDEERYVNKFRPTTMKAVHLWCSGTSFHEIMKDTKLFEGTFEFSFNSNEEKLF